MLEPAQFRVNEAWIAFKLNDAPVVTKDEGDYNVFALMDAASLFILAAEFVRADSKEPSQLESERLLAAGKSHKQEFPEKLFIPTGQAADILSTAAEGQGITVVRIPERELSVFVREARDGFREHVSRDRRQ